MDDIVIRFCVASFNIISVVLMMYRAPEPNSAGERFLRVFLALVYMVTMFLFIKGVRDEDNNSEDDDV